MHTRRRYTLAAAGLALGLWAVPAGAASHREAPLMTLDPGADITDVYAFVSYDADNVARPLAERRVTLIMNAVPGQEPGSGPNYFAFDDNVLYVLHVDNNRDGVAEDVSYEFEFNTQVENPDQFLATLGGGPLPPIDTLDAAGLSRKQRYTVTEVRNCRKGGRKCDRTVLFGGKALLTVPSNIGPRTMPQYEALAAQGIYTDPDTNIRVFAGQRAETFAIDLGAVFDTLNLRRPLPAQSAAEDADDTKNPFGFNNFSGFNVNTIALEVPITRLTKDGKAPTAETGTIGMYASTSRQKETVRRGAPAINPKKPPRELLRGEKRFVQVSRMANPLVNELIIPIGNKDLWNATEPEDEGLLLRFYQNLQVADALQAVSGVPVPPKPRDDIVHLLTQYADQKVSDPPFAELLRLDTTVDPTPVDKIRRLGPFAHDADGKATPDMAGFPNGRRPNDDVTDLVVRVAGGKNYIENFVGDGVGIQEKGITPAFPFLPTPYDGRDRKHLDPGE
ncbi:MAG: DUF4331 domain-containing protein [Deltaproteobacteria bacterium]|nr:MAG: DUF4331 domain-containing protein [Deltaproteobacteria bacterium]